ncbi:MULTISPECIES: MBL fold metallo-hydrolase [Rhizobium]|uniref:Beta-lactamase-like protein n=1 Tax=Rhizobium favelukesii TaxID=348824 RepID=W6RIN8_9HYPH|nr:MULTISPECIES: MBL fold metallo-hydrolase [Rhizobium]MCA0806840.1 MBL fold metallo-hydrolase [Rhizobium sp. T1473]MCS0460660.1 MBL fold metallo-hydrolase [Rhizobium favelukesii]UFS85761.1 MBL fold metallo-hydrolase [Rhizobium sp. T136]CDM61027.1 beta-lactamase-like protein [Rhizobium favelukesii]
MICFICTACGTQFDERQEPPQRCPICEDERQFVPETGQQFTDMTSIGRTHEVIWKKEAEGIHSLEISPSFAIGQRAFFVNGPAGNILWDCLSLVDEQCVARIKAAGGLAAIVISHPHFYASMVEWSTIFNGVPIYAHADDREWVQRSDPALHSWEDDTMPLGQATIVRCGGHFPGSSVLHCPWLEGGRGALFVGDTMQIALDRKYVSFMRSYPNLIPLNARTVEAIVEAVRPYPFEAIYGAFAGRTIKKDGMRAVMQSMERYIRAIES